MSPRSRDPNDLLGSLQAQADQPAPAGPSGPATRDPHDLLGALQSQAPPPRQAAPAQASDPQDLLGSLAAQTSHPATPRPAADPPPAPAVEEPCPAEEPAVQQEPRPSPAERARLAREEHVRERTRVAYLTTAICALIVLATGAVLALFHPQEPSSEAAEAQEQPAD